MSASTLARPVPRPVPDTPARRPRWVRPGLAILLGTTALLYLWGLGASGNANEFYAAAVQAGTQSWKAWLFGALDPGAGITVDKPPAALWLMAASGRIFGFSSWSMLVPQALCGIGSVAATYGAVRRVSGYAAGLLAGTVLATTPVAVLMFRFNNPDALLVLLLCVGGYATVRAIEQGSTGWLALAGSTVGFGFLTKMLQAFLVLPAFALAYLVAAPVQLRRRIWQLLVAGVGTALSAGWYVALVAWWPAVSRPYIDNSTDNSLLQLAFGYNGLDRVLGNGGPGGGNGPAGGGFGGATGLGRMFSTQFGAQVSWLLPAAMIALGAGLWLTRRAPRTDRLRASLLLWGGWLVVTGGVFSYMAGIIHPYYTVALAPAIGAVTGIGATALWARRAHVAARVTLAAMVVVTGAWSYALLHRTPSWQPWLRYTVLVLALAAAVWLIVDDRPLHRLALTVTGVLVVAGLAAPAGYSLDTAATPHNGSIPAAGPGGGSMVPGGLGSAGGKVTVPPRQAGTGAMPGGGGMPGREGSNAALTVLLRRTAGVRWAAATVGSQSAADLELSSGASVLAVGGWSGSDAYPTLTQFRHYVSTGQVRYFVPGMGGPGSGRGGPGGSGTSSQISSWVAGHFTARTIGGATVYDLSAGR